MTSFLGIKYPLRATGVIGKTIWSYIILSITWRLRVNFYWLYGSRSLIWNSCCRDCKISTCTSTPRHWHSLNELRRVSYILVRQSTTTIYHRKTEACKHWWMFPSSLRELKLCNRGNSLPVHGLRNLNSWFVSIQVVRYKVIPDSGYTSFYFDTCRSAVAVACTVTFISTSIGGGTVFVCHSQIGAWNECQSTIPLSILIEVGGYKPVWLRVQCTSYITITFRVTARYWSTTIARTCASSGFGVLLG